jgi:glucokinase
MQKSLYYVGVDVGGSAIKGGVVDDNGKPLSSVSLETEAAQGQEHGLQRMAETVRQAVATAKMKIEQIAAIGVATPGTMDIPAGLILDPPNLKPWKNVPVRQYIHDTFQKPTAFQNDANAAAYGEFWAGAGRGAHSLVLFTLGTGIGGGIIIGDLVIEGEHSHGAEVGHTKIQMTNPRICGCGGKGCLEAYASATSVVKRTQEALGQDGGKSSLHALVKSGKELNSRVIFDAGAAGDQLAARVVEDTAFYLAVGAANLMHTVDPDLVVFSGGMIAAGEKFLDRIRHHVQQLALPVPAAKTKIVYAQLGADAGFIGAAACARLLLRAKKG